MGAVSWRRDDIFVQIARGACRRADTGALPRLSRFSTKEEPFEPALSTDWGRTGRLNPPPAGGYSQNRHKLPCALPLET
jgi:hypothetical protein